MFNMVPIASSETESSKLSLFGSLTTDLVVLGGTLGLAFLGVAITYVNQDLSFLYWVTMVPVFGSLCFVAQWSRRRSTEMKWSRLVLTELLHWGGLLLAVTLIYTLLSAGNIPRATTGMVTLLLFTLVTFLYGVHAVRGRHPWTSFPPRRLPSLERQSGERQRVSGESRARTNYRRSIDYETRHPYKWLETQATTTAPGNAEAEAVGTGTGGCRL